MRQSVSAIFAAGLALCATACHNSDDLRKIEDLTLQHQQDSMKIAELSAKVKVMQGKVDAAMSESGTIALSNANDGMPAGDVDAFNAQIDALAATINASKAEVAQLRTQLASSKGQNSTLSKKVADLEKSIAAKEASIATMRAKAAQDQSKIADLSAEVQALSEQAVQNVNMIRELVAQAAAATTENNRAYYVVGTQDQLEAKGIIEKAKGITRARIWTGKTDPSLYTLTDKRSFDGLLLNVSKVKDVKVITSQSASSYTLTPNDGTVTFKVTNPDAFWESGRYVVIVLSASL